MKKFTLTILISILLVSLTACGNNDDKFPKEENTEVETETKNENVNENDNKDENDSSLPETEVTEENDEAKLGENAVALWSNKKIIVLIGDKVMPICELGEDEYASEVLLKDEYVYFIKSYYVGVDFHSSLYVYDLKGNQVFSYDFDENIGNSSLDIMEGKVYLSFQEGYRADANMVYTVDAKQQKLSFEQFYSDSLNRFEDEGITFGRESLFYAMNNASDEMYGWDSYKHKPVTISRDNLEVTGEADVLTTDAMSCLSFVGDMMLLDSYNPSRMYVANLKDKSIVPITGEDDGACFLRTAGGCFLTYIYDGSEFGLDCYNISVYDPKNAEWNKLYSAKEKPGSSFEYFAPGITGVALSNDCIYYMDSDGSEYYWTAYDMKKKCDTGRKIDATPYAYADYLEIYGQSETAVLQEKNNIEYFQGYMETPCLKEGISHNTERINDAIKQYINGEISVTYNSIKENAYNDFEMYESEDDHSYAYSFSWVVSGVKLIGSDYISIEFSGYDYYGGVHGYPYMDVLLFRRSTGEQVELADIIGLTPQMYSRVVAKKTVEDFKNDTTGRYFGDNETFNETEYFETILEYVPNYDSLSITYEEEGIKVYFPPYMLGPFSSGYIDIFIGYDELNMTMD